MRCATLTSLLLGVMLYLVMGALVFLTLETPEETLAHRKMVKTKKFFLSNNSCVTELDFHELVKGVVTAMEAGLDVNSLSANLTTRWDMASAIFFSGTIITTIGFGNLSPRTWCGQLFCVCYALVGIPMFGILLAGVGDHMGTVLRRAVAKIETLFLKRKVRPTTVRVISAVLSILIGCVIFLAVPTMVFHEVEDWTFLQSLYFVVITLTTVGFGDFVPGGGNKDGKIFKPLVLLWIVFGLAYFASILTMIGNWLRVLSKRTRAEMEELRAHATDWTQNMDFRIPNPLEFNDPFLLQRRRWKRSERRRIRRGAQCTVGYLAQRGSENGHLPNRWAGLSSSMSQLNAHSSLERAGVAKCKPQGGVPGAGALLRAGAPPRALPGLRVDPPAGRQGRAAPHLLARSFSLPAARSTLELEAAALRDGSYSGSESLFDSRSEGSSAGSSSSGLNRFQHCRPTSDAKEGGGAFSNTTQEPDKQVAAETVKNRSHKGSPSFTITPCSSPPPPPPSLLHVFPPSPDAGLAPPPSCKLLDFFGENLAYIDESSDTLSDRGQASEERRRRPRKPKRRSMRRQLSRTWSPLMVRRASMQPPSNPPTPPPDSSLSDRQTDSAL